MLESNELLILPWTSDNELKDAGPEVRARRIVDAGTGALLGEATWCARRWPTSWWHGRIFRVHEGPDRSLVMTVHRPAGPLRMWQVRDAEERFVGTFYGNFLFDGLGYVLAGLHEDSSGGGKFLTRSGIELGSWKPRRDGACCLRFSSEPESSPFARMILLGKSLSIRKSG